MHNTTIDNDSDDEIEGADNATSFPVSDTQTAVTIALSDTSLCEEELGMCCRPTCHAENDEVLSIHAHVLYVHVVYIPLCIHTVETSQPLVVNTAATVLVPPEPDCLEMEENECVQSFVSCGCGCQLWGGKSCSGQFYLDHFLEFRGQCKELTRAELDMALLGQLNAFMFSSEPTARSTTQRHPSDGRQRVYTVFWHRGVKVCRKAFLFLHTISEKRFKNLKSSILLNGLSPRMHETPDAPLQTPSVLPIHSKLCNTSPLMLRHMPYYCREGYQAISGQTCSFYHPTQLSAMFGYSTVTPSSHSLLHTIQWHTPPSVKCGSKCCHI